MPLLIGGIRFHNLFATSERWLIVVFVAGVASFSELFKYNVSEM